MAQKLDNREGGMGVEPVVDSNEEAHSREDIRRMTTCNRKSVIWTYLFGTKDDYELAKAMRDYQKETRDTKQSMTDKLYKVSVHDSIRERVKLLDTMDKLNPDLRISNFREGTVYTACKYFPQIFGTDFGKFLACADAVETLRSNKPSIFDFADRWRNIARYCGSDLQKLLSLAQISEIDDKQVLLDTIK